jgi:hypothetical protein
MSTTDTRKHALFIMLKLYFRILALCLLRKINCRVRFDLSTPAVTRVCTWRLHEKQLEFLFLIQNGPINVSIFSFWSNNP